MCVLEFATKDNEVYDTIKDQRSTCYYMGMREPPNNPNKYQLTTEFWSDFTWKLVFLVSFEVRIIIAYFLPFYFTIIENI